eukprot:2632820-Amphidinium_carterae.1
MGKRGGKLDFGTVALTFLILSPLCEHLMSITFSTTRSKTNVVGWPNLTQHHSARAPTSSATAPENRCLHRGPI